MTSLSQSSESDLLIVDLPTLEATQNLGDGLASLLERGDVITLRGDLGAGKSVLARSIIHALGVDEDVPSPTFTLVQTYPVANRSFDTIWHFDLYRLSSSDEVWELGIEDAFEEGVSLIEWPDRMGADLPARRLEIAIAMKGDGRQASFRCGTGWQERLAGKVLAV